MHCKVTLVNPDREVKQVALFARVAPDNFAGPENGAEAKDPQARVDSQDYQAFLYKYHVEFYRRHKFDPCNGCLFFHFKDCWPAITASVVDYYGEKKKAWYTLRQAFSPLHVMMEWPDLEGESAGATLCKAVHVVNDYHRPCESLTVQWQVVDAGGAVVAGGSIACGIADNGIAAVGEVVWQVPADATEQYTIRLRLGAADQHVSANEYPVRVRPGRSPWAARADHRAAAVPGAARPGHVSGRQHGDAAAHPHRARHAGLRRDAGVGRPAHPLRAPGERIGWRCSRLARPGPVRGGGGARLQLRRRRPPRRRRPLPVAVGSCAMRPEKGAFDAAGIANYVVSGDPMACTRPGAAACPWGPPESGRRFMTTADIESRLKELHGLPTPVRLWIVEMGPDSTDEPAVWVWIVLEREYDEVDPKERADLRELVRAAVREWVGDEAHWVYVRFHDGVLSGAAS